MRKLQIALFAGLALAGLAASPLAPIAYADGGAEVQTAIVRVRVHEADGTVRRAPARAVRWGERATFQVEGHAITLRPQQIAAGAKVEVEYRRGKVSAKRVAELRANRRAVVYAEAGARVSVVITPTRSRVETGAG